MQAFSSLLDSAVLHGAVRSDWYVPRRKQPLQPLTMPHVGAPPSGLLPGLPLVAAPLAPVPPDETPPDATPLDPPEAEPAPAEPDDSLPDGVPHEELQLCSTHWTTPLQLTLVQLEAAIQVTRADEHLLLTQELHVAVTVMPVTTETKSSGLLHPPATPPDPPMPPGAPLPEPVPPASPFWLSVAAGPPLPNPLPSPPLFPAHADAALNEPATAAVHAAALSMPAS